MPSKYEQLIFIDDSGDPGFKNASSTNFIMASAVFIDRDIATTVNAEISSFKKSLGWSEETELKFSKTNKKYIKQVLEIVSSYNFAIYSVYVDKTSYKNLAPIIDNEKLYNWTIKELLKTIPLKNAHIVIDGFSTKEHQKKFASYIRHEINQRDRKIISIKTADSKKDNLIQLADLIAGSINRFMQPEKTDTGEYISILEERVVELRCLDLKNK